MSLRHTRIQTDTMYTHLQVSDTESHGLVKTAIFAELICEIQLRQTFPYLMSHMGEMKCWYPQPLSPAQNSAKNL